jgi:peptidoglycan/LPS O-acetylase OafA/YrhL
LYAVVLVIFLFREQLLQSYYPVRVAERIFIAIVFLMVILEQNYASNSFYKAGNFKFISRLGTITYGLYCLHFIGILITTNTTKQLQLNIHLWQVIIVETALALLITIIIGTLSYRYFESPFLKLKDKLSYIRKP